MDAKFHVMAFQGPLLHMREHRKRRFHAKDKHGCSQCKQRRVKCDQHRPACLRCARNRRQCVYEEPAAVPSPSPVGPSKDEEAGSLSDQPNPSLSPGPGPLSIVQPTATSLATVVAESNSDALSPWVKEHGTSLDHLLHHFNHNSMVIMGGKLDQQFWDLACRYSFLVSTMLAVSASHLRHHTPNPSRHQIAELGQKSAAITALKSALAIPLHKESADALLCAAVMLNAVTFAFVESLAVSTSWVFSDSADRLGWLDLQLRFRKLEEVTSQFRESSFLQPMLDGQNPGDAEDPAPDKVPKAWRMLIDDEDPQISKLYREPVLALAELRLLEPDCLGSFAYIGLVGKLEDGFRDLLFEKDPRALWIFGYWLGLLGRLGIWWCARRVERDWGAVRRFLRDRKLEQRPGQEGRMWQALVADLGTAPEWPSPESAKML